MDTNILYYFVQKNICRRGELVKKCTVKDRGREFDLNPMYISV